MKLRQLIVCLLSVALGTSCSVSVQFESDCGFVQNSRNQRVSWDQFPIEFYVHKDVPESYYPAILEAMNQWMYTTNIAMFELVGVYEGTEQQAEKDDINVIYNMSSWETGRSREQARTIIYWTETTIHEADIQLNASDHQFDIDGGSVSPLKVDLISLMVHELGHVLGLKHTDDIPSVMNSYLESGTERRELTMMDIESLKCEYPTT